jgi:hypothetical protein
MRLILLLLLGILPVPVSASAQEPLTIPRLTGQIVLDGRSDEPAWQSVEPVSLTMFQPVHGGAPSERTEVRFAYDADAFYASARLYDSDPAGIRATTLKRDILNWANDYFCFLLDTFNDKENALGFCTTPGGLRLEYAVQGDVSGPDPVNEDWNTYWDVEVARDETGWFAEIRVPWSSLRFQPEGDRLQMGLSTFRLIARKGELAVFPMVPSRWGTVGVNKPSQMHPIAFEGVRSRRPLYVAPYALGGLGQSYALNAAKTAYERTDGPAREVGMDLKYGLTSNLTLDVTYNTDFAQVEADDQQVNLSRFPLFFPEKRAFFQERASNFEFHTGGPSRVFYSRRIGVVEGQPVPIIGGARMVGRAGRWDVGFLDMQTAETEAHPSENMGVLRLRRRVLNPHSYAGAILTSRISQGGTYSLAYGADAILRLFGNDYLTLQWVQTSDGEDSDGFGLLRTSLARLWWERRAIEGLGGAVVAMWTGPDYNPALGYVNRRGIIASSRVNYGRRGSASSGILRQIWGMSGYANLRSHDGSVETWWLEPKWKLEMKSRSALELIGRMDFDAPERAFRLAGGLEVPAGSYLHHDIRAVYETPDGRPIRAEMELRGGSFYDGRRVVAALTPTWNVSRHLELGGTYQYNRVDFSERGQHLQAHVGRLRAQAMLNTRVSAAAFAQYNSATDAVTTNVRLRYNPREGNDLYLVYNHGIHTDRERLEPALPFTDARTVLIKYTRTFDLGF